MSNIKLKNKTVTKKMIQNKKLAFERMGTILKKKKKQRMDNFELKG